MSAPPVTQGNAPVAIDGSWGRIEGQCSPAFAGVAKAFVANFVERGEVGAALCITHRGQRVVDLWGGRIGAAPEAKPWQADTLTCVFSCTKAATALTVHALVADGVLDLDAPLADLWPEFAAQGKGTITLRMVLDHRAALPVLRAPVKADALMDHDYMAMRLAEEAPFWTPGSRVGYHPFTFGFLIAEVVRRATGQTLGQVFAQRIAVRNAVDLHIGLSDMDEARVAPTILWKPDRESAPAPFFQAAKRQGTLQHLFAFNHGTWAVREVNTRQGRTAENAAAGGMASARGLCSLLTPLVSPEGIARLGLRPDQVVGFRHATSETARDETVLQPMRFSSGFMAAIDARSSGGDNFLIGPEAFGHVGAGGSITLADPEAELGFGYVMNRQGAGLLANPRGQSLIAAAYQACTG